MLVLFSETGTREKLGQLKIYHAPRKGRMQLETGISTLSIGTILLLSADATMAKYIIIMMLVAMGEHLRRSETFL